MGSSLQFSKHPTHKLLISAATLGDASHCKTLLLNGANVNAADNTGVTPLIRAATHGHIDVVDLLLKFNADISVQDITYGNTALHEAAWRGYSRTVALLAKSLGSQKAVLHAQNIAGFAPLHLACQNGHNQTCRELLQAGCNPDLQNNYGDTSLHTSVRYGHAGVTRILISASCQVSIQNKNGDTALHIAAAMSRRKLTRILLEAGCDQPLINKQGETAKSIARRKNLVDILEIFDHFESKSNKPKVKSLKQVIQQSRTNNNVNYNIKGLNAIQNDYTENHDAVDNGNLRKKYKHKNYIHHNHHNNKIQSQSKDIIGKEWSPYGCHYYPDLKSFPQPKLDSLPPNPLSFGEQYYLDLAGNIKKGPIGVGHICYCAPFFKHIEVKLKKNKAELKARIDNNHEQLQMKVNHLEQKTQVQVSELTRLIASEKSKYEEKYKHLQQQIFRRSLSGRHYDKRNNDKSYMEESSLKMNGGTKSMEDLLNNQVPTLFSNMKDKNGLTLNNHTRSLDEIQCAK